MTPAQTRCLLKIKLNGRVLATDNRLLPLESPLYDSRRVILQLIANGVISPTEWFNQYGFTEAGARWAAKYRPRRKANPDAEANLSPKPTHDELAKSNQGNDVNKRSDRDIHQAA